MLNPSDVYVSGGSNNLLACWTDKVTKYDASSFYNWEQDNLPLHDLDERTHLLWEKFGHPTSALTGMSFIVSADATSSCNPLYFTTLSACINALPEVINYPILVEVASFGNLGGINLSNKSFGPHGALEIINRNCAFQGGISNNGSIYGGAIVDSDSSYGLVSSLIPGLQPGQGTPLTTWNLNATTRDLSGFPGIAIDAIRSRLFTRKTDGSEIFVASGSEGSLYADSRFVNPYVFAKRSGTLFDRLTASLSSTISPWDTSPSLAIDLSSLDFVPYDRTPTTEMTTYDVSTINQLNDTEIQWGFGKPGSVLDPILPTKAAIGSVYFNNLDYIKVKNCDGPIYLRNFNVDAKNARSTGIEIINSRVHLERTSVSRANKAGLYVSESDVDLARGFVAYRNYELDGSTRTGIPFLDKITTYKTQSSYGKGIYALNSTINLLSTYDRSRNEYFELLTTDASAVYTDYFSRSSASTVNLPIASNEELYCLSRNDIGIHCVNSKIFGGMNERPDYLPATQAKKSTSTQFFSELNTEAGIKLDNSVMSYNGRLAVDGNYFGIDAVNSTLEVNSLNARYNQSVGIKLDNCSLDYNKDVTEFEVLKTATDVESHRIAQICGIQNGQDIVCNNSNIQPLYTSSMPSIYGMVYTSGCFGVENDINGLPTNPTLLPSIEADNNSKLDLVHTHIDRTGLESELTGTEATYGALIRATNNSTVNLKGSKQFANVLLGPGTRDEGFPLAAVYVGDQSKASFQGPTVIAQVGVDVLADKQSVIDFGPHRHDEGGLLVSAFDLSGNPDNHTMVELHSTRACLVADQQSEIYMKDLGDYSRLYADSSSVSGRSDNYDYPITDLYQLCVSNGWMQLYPNGNLASVDVPDTVANLPSRGQNARYRFVSDAAPINYKYLESYATLNTDASNVTTGGMSVRAVGDSLVQVTNVHFPCGWANCSGYAYDFEGAPPLPGPICSRLHIWNIADDSLLKASYVSVSGVHPVDAPYHGPSGTWGLSGAPSSTPDTSSLSVLDYYGVGTDNPFGQSTIENKGPFRLYFSVDPASKFLDSSAGGFSGIPFQLFSQGYMFSSNMVVVGNNDFDASAKYTSLLRRNEAGNIVASGFYYPSEMLSNPDTILASLDDSASNMFANAKHNSVDKSLIGKRVEIFYPTDGFGGDASRDTASFGEGLLSVNNFDLKKDN